MRKAAAYSVTISNRCFKRVKEASGKFDRDTHNNNCQLESLTMRNI